MRNNFAFLPLTNVISNIILLPKEAKDKKYPFIIVNTDNDRGLYIRKLEGELNKYKNLRSESSENKLYDIGTGNLIVFGDSPNFDYRIDMNYVTLVSLTGRKDVKVYDLVEDFQKITRRLGTFCRNNGIRRKVAYRDDDIAIRLNLNIVEEQPDYYDHIRKASFCCPLLRAKKLVSYDRPTRSLVNIYSKPNTTVDPITVHSNWVKIGYNQYDIYVDLRGNEFIYLEDKEKLFVKTDRFGRRYLAV